MRLHGNDRKVSGPALLEPQGVPWTGGTRAEVVAQEAGVRPGHKSVSVVDAPPKACLGSPRRSEEAEACSDRLFRGSARRAAQARRRPTSPFPPRERVEGGIAREVEQA